MRRADGDNAVGIARIGDAERRIALVGAVLGLEVLIAAVARRRDDDHAAVDQPFAFVATGVRPQAKLRTSCGIDRLRLAPWIVMKLCRSLT